MTLQLHSRDDFTLESYRRVAWGGEGVRFSGAAMETMAYCRVKFEELIEDPDVVVYGVTSGPRSPPRRLLANRCPIGWRAGSPLRAWRTSSRATRRYPRPWLQARLNSSTRRSSRPCQRWETVVLEKSKLWLIFMDR